MLVEVKSSRGNDTVPLETKLFTERNVFITGEICNESAVAFMKQILFLTTQSNDPINIFVNSPGGEIISGLLMYDIITGIQDTPINMICVGNAYSMAAVLMIAGHKGRRYMLPKSELMLHEPLLGGRVGGNSSSIKMISDSLLDSKKKINEILANHTGKSLEEIEKAISGYHYWGAKEAVDFGLVDKILDFSEIKGGL